MLKIDEKYFEDLLFENLQTPGGTEHLNSKGLNIVVEDNFKLYRQLNLKEYGIPDIVRIAFEGRSVRISIIELKVVEFDLSHLIQIGRYKSCIKQLCKANPLLQNRYYDISTFLIVAGFRPAKEYVWVDSLLRHDCHVYNTTYDLDGINFEKQMPANWQNTGASTTLSDYIDVGELFPIYKTGYRNSDNREDLPF